MNALDYLRENARLKKEAAEQKALADKYFRNWQECLSMLQQCQKKNVDLGLALSEIESAKVKR